MAKRAVARADARSEVPSASTREVSSGPTTAYKRGGYTGGVNIEKLPPPAPVASCLLPQASMKPPPAPDNSSNTGNQGRSA